VTARAEPGMRRLLVLLVTATTSIVVIALIGPMAALIQRFATEDALAAASLEVQAVETTVAFQDRADLVLSLRALNNHDPRIRTTVLFPDGDVIGPDKTVTDEVLRARESGRAVSTTADDGGVEVLVPVAVAGENETLDTQAVPGEFAVIRVTVTEGRINQQVFIAWAIIGALGAGLLLLAALVASRLAANLARPVNELAGVARQLGGGDLRARVRVSGPPELQEVGHALNQLAGRITELLAAERESVADVSHRLRTPLAALRLEAGELRDAQERERNVAAVDAMSRALDDVIRQARRPVRDGLRALCDARAVVAERTAFWAVLAEDQGRAMRCELPASPLPVRTGAEDLAAAVDVLLDNVLSHTPDGTDFEVSLSTRSGTGALLVVDDRGSGAPAAGGLLERGTSGAGSTGLGLDIARCTAEASGGRLEIGRNLHGGTSIRLHLGSAPELPPPVLPVAPAQPVAEPPGRGSWWPADGAAEPPARPPDHSRPGPERVRGATPEQTTGQPRTR
jgi:signal transduction histidine kinase